jgi:hypothetical protein
VKGKTLTSAGRVLSLFLLASGFYGKADTLIKLTSGTSQTTSVPTYWGRLSLSLVAASSTTSHSIFSTRKGTRLLAAMAISFPLRIPVSQAIWALIF